MKALPGLRPAILLLLGLGFIISLFAFKQIRYKDITALTGFGCQKSGTCMASINKHVMPRKAFVFDSGGYDGQFYYYLAHSLYTGSKIHLDDPILRSSRIGYPALTGWAVVFFGSRGIVYVMLLLPVAMHLLTGFLFYRYARSQNFGPGSANQATLAALIFVFNPFSLTCFLLSVADALAMSLALISMIFFLRLKQNSGIFGLFCSAIFMSLAVLTKESSLILLPFYMIYLILNNPVKNPGYPGWLVVIVPIVAITLWWRFTGFHALGQARLHAGYPFSGLFQFLLNPDALFSGRSLFVMIVLLSAAFVLFSIAQFIKSKKYDVTLPGAILILSGSLFYISLASYSEYWTNYANIVRFGIMLVPAFGLIAVHSRSFGWQKRWIQLVLLVFMVWDYWILRDVLFTPLAAGKIILSR